MLERPPTAAARATQAVVRTTGKLRLEISPCSRISAAALPARGVCCLVLARVADAVEVRAVEHLAEHRERAFVAETGESHAGVEADVGRLVADRLHEHRCRARIADRAERVDRRLADVLLLIARQ